jgi:hypothetical protein
MTNRLEAEMKLQRERQKPKTHKPECVCWRCRRRRVPKEEFMPSGHTLMRRPER